MLWAPVGGLCIANDDIKFVRGPGRDMPLLEALSDAWWSQPIFRPLEIIVGHLSDPVTLECTWAMVVQGAGLLALLAGVRALCVQAMPGHRLAHPVVQLMVLLSPATTVSVWQMDACSQTWTAALGVWSAALAWRWIGSGSAGARPAWCLLALSATMAAGLLIKENFYGWSLGLGVACTAAVVWLGRGGWRAASGASLALLPVVGLTALHLALRIWSSALLGTLSGDGESRYRAEFGSNLLTNAMASLGAAVGTGPFHAIGDVDSGAALRLMSLVSIALVAALIMFGLGIGLMERARPGVRWRALAFASTACILSLSATVPMGSVSELYGCGANVGCAMLAVAGALALWHAGSGHAILRAAVAGALGLVLCIGTYGLASRAHHFGVVWSATRALNESIVGFQSTLAPSANGSSAPAGIVHAPTECLRGFTHSQYVMPPLQALDVPLMEEWLRRRDPSRPVAFSIGTAPSAPRPNELVLDCAALPQHGHW
ncbi:MAG: hypothetical protein FGM37_01300 [Phycisphaerales bacterium]|nr:hypothetical protein [Phycisphaerales bacterium]